MKKAKTVMITLEAFTLISYITVTLAHIINSLQPSENTTIAVGILGLIGYYFVNLLNLIHYGIIASVGGIGIGIARIYEDKKRKIYFICITALSILTLIVRWLLLKNSL